jgi:hypothetical protein
MLSLSLFLFLSTVLLKVDELASFELRTARVDEVCEFLER